MGELKNNFSWSVSRDRCFRGCKREYYYTYYGYWGGWALDAPEEIRLAYILKNMTSFPLWGGAIVHDTIKEVLTVYQETQEFPKLEAIQQKAVDKLRTGWRQSRKKLWERDPKRNINLFEHYYGEAEGNSITKEEADAFKAGILDALDAFYHSDTLQELLRLPLDNWESVDTLESFEVECDGKDIPVWCAIDLAYIDASGKLHIVDWKTGREHREELLRQLAFYAYYAMKKWRIPFEDILLEGVILNDGGRISPYFISKENVESALEQMRASVRLMKKALKNPENNEARSEDFSPCASPEKCQYCRFRALCQHDFGG